MTETLVPIFIINMKTSVDRKTFIQHQFDSLMQHHPAVHIDYQFFEAINGKENPDFPLFKKHNAKKRFERKGSVSTLGQLGCFASHYLLWEKCVALNAPIIVLEDDAILHQNFLSAYQFLCQGANQFEFLWLSPPSPAKRNQPEKPIYAIPNSDNYVAQFYGQWSNTTGYYLTPKAAKKFLAQSQEWIFDVDITMERYWENDVSYLALKPFCLEPNFELESNVPIDKGRANRTLLIRLKREYYKIQDKIKKRIFDLRHR